MKGVAISDSGVVFLPTALLLYFGSLLPLSERHIQTQQAGVFSENTPATCTAAHGRQQGKVFTERQFELSDLKYLFSLELGSLP